MRKVDLSLSRLSPEELISEVKPILINMSNDPDYNDKKPTLSSITGIVEQMENMFTEIRITKETLSAQRAAMHKKEAELRLEMSSLSKHVEIFTKGDPVLIKKTGMKVRSINNKSPEIHSPQNLIAAFGDENGEIYLRWEKCKGAKSYIIELTNISIASQEGAMPEPSMWQHHAVSIRSSFMVKDLKPGNRYYFRIAAVGSKGQSPWSDIATKIV